MQEIQDCFLDPDGAAQALADLLRIIKDRYRRGIQDQQWDRYELILLRPENIWTLPKTAANAVAVARLGRSANVGLVLRTDAPDASSFRRVDLLPITLFGSVELRDLITLQKNWPVSTVRFEYSPVLTANI